MGAQVAHGRATFLFLQTVDVHVPDKVVGLVLEHPGHEPLPFEHDFLAFEVDPLDLGVVGTLRLEPQSGKRQAAFVAVLFALELEDLGVEQVPQFAVDVI